MNVLIIDDDRWFFDCYSNWLKAKKYIVEYASNAQAALDYLDSKKVDLIILDIFLPSSNGIQFLNTISSYGDLGKIPTLVLSAVDFRENDFGHKNVVAVLNKTLITKQTLLEVVGNALS